METTRIETQSKWVSKYSHGDTVRHKTGHEKRLINAVIFNMGSLPQYRCGSESNDVWWFEDELVRVV